MSISNGFPEKIKLATKTSSGMMSSSDKIKLDSIDVKELKEALEYIRKMREEGK